MNYVQEVYKRRHENGLHPGYVWSKRMAKCYTKLKGMEWYNNRMREFTSACKLTDWGMPVERKHYSN